MSVTKFYLDLRGKAKDGMGSILISLYHNSTTATFATGIRVKPDNWQDQMIINLPDAKVLNAKLLEKKVKIDKAIAILSLDDRFQSMSATEVKNEISNDKQKVEKGHLVSELFADYTSSSQLKPGTKQIYSTTLKKILAFGGKDIKLEAIDLRWLRSFDQYLSKTQGYNGRAIYLRSFRAVFNYATHIGIKNHHYPFEQFQIKHEQTRKRCIPVELLQEFYKYPTTKQNAMYRDYFFLMFYLIGINTIDLLLCKKSQISNGRLDYIRAKTGKSYSIKIEPEAEALLKKYEGKGEYLLEAMDHCRHYRSFAHELNDALKTIGRKEKRKIYSDDLFSEIAEEEVLIPAIPMMSSYYARHTWATLAHEAGVPLDIISCALGHSYINRTTLIYVKPDQSKVDEANRKVIDYFLNGL